MSPQRWALLELLEQYSGPVADQIAGALGLQYWASRKALQRARAAGLIVADEYGRWWLSERGAARMAFLREGSVADA